MLAVSSHLSSVQLFRRSTPQEASCWDLDLCLALLSTSWVTLSKSANLCEPQFLHLYDQDNNTCSKGIG